MARALGLHAVGDLINRPRVLAGLMMRLALYFPLGLGLLGSSEALGLESPP